METGACAGLHFIGTARQFQRGEESEEHKQNNPRVANRGNIRYNNGRYERGGRWA